MKSFMTLVFLIIIASVAAYFFNADVRKFVDNQLIYDAGLKSHVTYGYKWQDENGAWQLTQHPPSGGIPYEKVEVRDDWNVMDLPEKLK